MLVPGTSIEANHDAESNWGSLSNDRSNPRKLYRAVLPLNCAFIEAIRTDGHSENSMIIGNLLVEQIQRRGVPRLR